MLKRFTQLVSKIPFAGKLAIRPAFRNFLKARKSMRHVVYAWVSGLLGLMVWGHTRQAMMGLRAIQRGLLQKIHIFWHVVFVGYTAANVAVTIAQAYLLGLCSFYYFTQKKTRLIGSQKNFTASEMLIMVVVTLGGQILFGTGSQMLT